MRSSDYPLAAWDERNDFARDGTADESENSDCWNGKADRDERIGLIASHKVSCDGGKEEQVHEVHAKG